MGSNNRLDVDKIMSYDRGDSGVSMIGTAQIFLSSHFVSVPLIL